MSRIYLICYMLLLLAFGHWCSVSFRQERAIVKMANTKYIKDVVVFTGRKSRNEPYLSNMTATLLMPYGNNVTVTIILSPSTGGDFRILVKVCDSIKNKWMNEFMQSFTNLTLHRCPFPAGRYSFYNMELPPKNIPIPFGDGDYFIKYELSQTNTKEKILECVTLLHHDTNKKKKKGKGLHPLPYVKYSKID